MTCEERRDLLLLMAAGALDPVEEAELREHLATPCAECLGAWAEAEATFHQVPLGLGRRRVPESAWESVETRVALHEQMEPAAPVEGFALARPAPQRPMNMRLLWLGWAVAAGVAIAIGWPLYDANQTVESDRREIAALHVAQDAMPALQRRVDELLRQVNLLKEEQKGAEAQVAEKLKEKDDLVQSLLRSDRYAVGGPGMDIEQPEVKGALYWDKKERRWMLYASHVKAPAEGMMYELWIITDTGQKIGAVVGKPDDKGDLMMQAALPVAEADGTLATATVTDEPQFEVVPTGKVQFSGSVK